MDHDKNPYIDHNSWMDCFGDLLESPKPPTKNPSLLEVEHLPNEPRPEPFQSRESNYLNQEIEELINLHELVDKNLFKRSHSDILLDDEFITSNSSSYEARNEDKSEGSMKPGYKKEKYAKQYIYSKNYRDKKKQQFKALQEQNHFLKNKIDELQARLREKQLQINRLKHHSTEKELTIEQLNRQFLTKVSLFAQKIQTVIQKQETPKLPPERKNAVYEELIRTYDEHGFAGSRKRDILSYYMDQILEVVLRDSEKYLCMICCKNKDEKLEKQFPEFQKINTAFFEIMDVRPEDEERFRKYINFLFPIMREIKKQCSELYKNYTKILTSMEKVHQFMKTSYGENLDFVKKRMKMESWFQYHKYHKIMRRLKEDWLILVKKQKSSQGKEHRTPKQPCKRQKTDEMDPES